MKYLAQLTLTSLFLQPNPMFSWYPPSDCADDRHTPANFFVLTTRPESGMFIAIS
jgi:hypothetical protein